MTEDEFIFLARRDLSWTRDGFAIFGAGSAILLYFGLYWFAIPVFLIFLWLFSVHVRVAKAITKDYLKLKERLKLRDQLDRRI